MVHVKFDVSRTKFDGNGNKCPERASYYFIKDGDFDIVWTNVVVFAIAHILLAQSIYMFFTQDSYYTFMWLNFLVVLGGMGVTGGSHRMWAHKAYEAKWPLRLILMIGQTIAGQNCIYIWARDHRVHHKWSDTDADPHNTKRGFFFTHCGWLLRKKHPEVFVKSKTLDFSDLDNDPIVKFQKDYYWAFYLTFALYLPMAIPVYAWGESWWTSYMYSYVARYVLSLHGTWFVNSAAHMFGERPYNSKIAPAENPWVSVITFGEGYHNYHHNYPSDYQASELGHGLNSTKHLLDFMAKIGWAYNMKTTSNAVVEATKTKVKALNNNHYGHHHEECSDDQYEIRHSMKSG